MSLFPIPFMTATPCKSTRFEAETDRVLDLASPLPLPAWAAGAPLVPGGDGVFVPGGDGLSDPGGVGLFDPWGVGLFDPGGVGCLVALGEGGVPTLCRGCGIGIPVFPPAGGVAEGGGGMLVSICLARKREICFSNLSTRSTRTVMVDRSLLTVSSEQLAPFLTEFPFVTTFA